MVRVQISAPLFLKNGGNKRTEPISVRIYCSAGCEMQPSAEWFQFTPSDTNYPSAYYLGAGGAFQNTIAAGETWTIENALTPILTTATNGNLRLEVFYGGDNAAVAKFSVFHR